jgi:hypothetical protein
MRSLFHRGEAYFIGAKLISPERNLWIKNPAPKIQAWDLSVTRRVDRKATDKHLHSLKPSLA